MVHHGSIRRTLIGLLRRMDLHCFKECTLLSLYVVQQDQQFSQAAVQTAHTAGRLVGRKNIGEIIFQMPTHSRNTSKRTVILLLEWASFFQHLSM